MKKLLCLIFAAASLLCGSLAFAESTDELVVSTLDYYTENDIKVVTARLSHSLFLIRFTPRKYASISPHPRIA